MTSRTTGAPWFTARLISRSSAFLAMTMLLAFMLQGCGGAGGAGSYSGTNTSDGSGRATLSWSAPSSNVDGTPLLDIAGYKIYYGTSSGVYNHIIDIGNATTFELTSLPQGATVYCVVTVYTRDGEESHPSNEVSKFVS